MKQDEKMEKGFALLDGKIERLITAVDGIAKNFKDHAVEMTSLKCGQDRLENRVDILEAAQT
ncbi:MAG: hypothetical protein ABIH21_03585 [Patescibacteria group bacterium]